MGGGGLTQLLIHRSADPLKERNSKTTINGDCS